MIGLRIRSNSLCDQSCHATASAGAASTLHVTFRTHRHLFLPVPWMLWRRTPFSKLRNQPEPGACFVELQMRGPVNENGFRILYAPSLTASYKSCSSSMVGRRQSVWPPSDRCRAYSFASFHPTSLPLSAVAHMSPVSGSKYAPDGSSFGIGGDVDLPDVASPLPGATIAINSSSTTCCSASRFSGFEIEK